MKLVLASLAFLSLSAAAANEGPYERYSRYSYQVTCDTLKADVEEAGALVVYRSPVLYELYVRNELQCPSRHKTAIAYAPTSDNPKCKMKKCVPRK